LRHGEDVKDIGSVENDVGRAMKGRATPEAAQAMNET